MPRHGAEVSRAIPDSPRSSLPLGRFGRLFGTLDGFSPPDGLLEQLGRSGGPMEDTTGRRGTTRGSPLASPTSVSS